MNKIIKKTKNGWKINEFKITNKNISYLIIGLLFIGLFGGALIFVKLLIPLITRLGEVFLMLARIYTINTSDIYILFFGGMIFFYIAFQIVLIVFQVWFAGMNLIITELKKEIKKLKK